MDRVSESKSKLKMIGDEVESAIIERSEAATKSHPIHKIIAACFTRSSLSHVARVVIVRSHPSNARLVSLAPIAACYYHNQHHTITSLFCSHHTPPPLATSQIPCGYRILLEGSVVSRICLPQFGPMVYISHG